MEKPTIMITKEYKDIDETIEDESLLSTTSVSPSASVSSRSSTDSLDKLSTNVYGLSIIETLSRSASSSSLASLGISIPSHKHFSKLIHKHEVPRKALHVS